MTVAGRVLWGAAGVVAVWTALTWLTGGFTMRLAGTALSSRDPLRPLAAVIVLLVAAGVLLGRRELWRLMAWTAGSNAAAPARLAVGAALAVLIAAVAWNTRAAGGSDSSCYLLQADAFAHGDALLRDPLAAVAPFSNAGALFAPTGWEASAVNPVAAAPICAPGLGLVMALALKIGGAEAVTFVVPLFAAGAIWATYAIGRRIDGPWTGALAALLLASSPIFLYQAVQPMSDVPATTLWVGALAASMRGDRWGDRVAGACAGLAILTRPNLALVVMPIAALIAIRGDRGGTGSWGRRVGRFAVWCTPFLVVLAWLNIVRYGAPWASGYGDTGSLFAAVHVWPNLQRYPRWLVATQTPFLLLSLAAPFWAWRRRRRDTITATVAALTAVALLAATYLAYVVFNDWWYIRFLLPALPVLLVFSVAVTTETLRFFAPRRAAVALAIVCGGLTVWSLHVARQRRVFELQAIESRFLVAGAYAARALPPNAAVLSVRLSGSLRYHGRRSTLTWDAIDPSALDATIAWLRRSGRDPIIALEDGEEPRFRERFPAQAFGRLDWPPLAEIHARVRVRLYDVAQRQAYLEGQRLSTEHVR